MATEDAVGTDRESQAEVDAVRAETTVTMDQVRRWRREGLLPNVVQDQQAYRGSVVFYPKGTCGQIRAASVLFKQKNRVDYVGLRLWRSGFSPRVWRDEKLASRDSHPFGDRVRAATSVEAKRPARRSRFRRSRPACPL
jgi:hypothetical protein